MGRQMPQKESESDLPVKGRRVSIEELLSPVSNCEKYDIHFGGGDQQFKQTKPRIKSCGYTVDKTTERIKTTGNGDHQDGNWSNQYHNSINYRKATEKDLIDFAEGDAQQQTTIHRIHSPHTDTAFEHDGLRHQLTYKPIEPFIKDLYRGQHERNSSTNEDLYDHELMETQVCEEYNSSGKILLNSGSEGNSENSESDEVIGSSRKLTESVSRCNESNVVNLPENQQIQHCNPNVLTNPNITCRTTQNRPLLLMDGKPKLYTYKNRFGKEILMKKHRSNTENTENSGTLVNNSMGAREIDDILAFLNEPSAGTKDNTRNKGKKRKTKVGSERIVVETTEVAKPEESLEDSLVIDTNGNVGDKSVEETDSMIAKTTEEMDTYEKTLHEAENFDSDITSKEPVNLRVFETISSLSENTTNIFITRADSFPTLNEANMRNDHVDGKHRRSPQIKPKTDLLFNKKSSKKPAHDSGVSSPAQDSEKFIDESFTSKVIIVDEDPSTPMVDITKSHGISFFYDQELEHRDGNEKKKGKKSEREKKTVAIVSDSGLGTSHTITTNDLSESEHSNMVSSPRAPIIQKANIRTLFFNVSKETNDLYERMANAWDTFQNKGAKPYIYECGKAL